MHIVRSSAVFWSTTLSVCLTTVRLVHDTRIWHCKHCWCYWRSNRQRDASCWSYAQAAEGEWAPLELNNFHRIGTFRIFILIAIYSHCSISFFTFHLKTSIGGHGNAVRIHCHTARPEPVQAGPRSVGARRTKRFVHQTGSGNISQTNERSQVRSEMAKASTKFQKISSKLVLANRFFLFTCIQRTHQSIYRHQETIGLMWYGTPDWATVPGHQILDEARGGRWTFQQWSIVTTPSCSPWTAATSSRCRIQRYILDILRPTQK